MAAPADPSTGRAFIWLITCFLFTSIAAGGTFLMLYMFLPETPSTAWLPIAGVSFVCLPWLFWFLTCFYRIISRACGFRVAFGGQTDVKPTNDRDHEPAVVTVVEAADESFDNEGRHVQFGPPVVLGQDHGNDRKSDCSVASHESEMPLASSMAC